VPLTVLPNDYQNTVPIKGDKRKLVELSLKNAFQYKKEKQRLLLTPEEPGILVKLKDDLKLSEIPFHIECFDNSNLQGTTPVAAMVCFRNGKPSKKDYRHFNVKTVEGPDDFASMAEVVKRRYSRVLEEKEPFPNLIIIDGGKGQLSAAVGSLRELNLHGNIHIIGIAKRLEELYAPGDQFPLHLSKSSSSLKLIQQIRDEAHRFAISFHRNKRDKISVRSELENIKGIGPDTISTLLEKFKSIKKIKEVSLKDLEKTIGKSKAEKLTRYFQKKREDSSSL
jgi:excinuclease ABC subunit C